MDSPRIYVASLSDYNNGRLHGAWIDADQDADAIRAEIAAMLASGAPGSEEWAIHDYEGFCGIELSEYEDIERVAELAQAIAEHGGAFAAFYDNEYSRDGQDMADIIEGFEEAYSGEFDDEDAFAWDFYTDIYGDPTETDHPLAAYMGPAVEAWGRDLFLGGDYWRVDAEHGGIYVFRNL